MQGIHSCQQPHGDIDMKVIGILGIAAAILAAGAAEVQVSDLTGNAKVSKFKIYGKNRVVNAGFPITALPADLAGETFVSVPRGAAGQPGAAYSVSVDRPARIYLLVQNRGTPAVPEGWTRLPATVCWGDNFTDSVYLKQLDAPGKVEVPAHDGRQGGNFGIPNALVITDSDRDALASPATESRMLPKNRMRVVGGNFVFGEFPAFLKDLEERHIHYNETLEELASLEKEGRIHIIRPSSPIQAAMIERDESNLERIYQTGRADMKKDLEKLKAYLDS